MTNPEQKKLVALNYYQNNQEEVKAKPFLDLKRIDMHLKKKLVLTNDEYHPSTQEYFKQKREQMVHDISHPVALRLSSRLDKESVYCLRKDMRRNFIDHKKYNVDIDTFLA